MNLARANPRCGAAFAASSCFRRPPTMMAVTDKLHHLGQFGSKSQGPSPRHFFSSCNTKTTKPATAAAQISSHSLNGSDSGGPEVVEASQVMEEEEGSRSTAAGAQGSA